MEVNGQCCVCTSESSQSTGVFNPTPITIGHTTFSVNDTPNLERDLASLKVVSPPNETFNSGTYHL